VDNDRHILIEEEIQAHRIAWDKVRGIVRVAVARNTLDDYRKGCLAAVALADSVCPRGRGYHGRNEGAPGAPGAG